MVLQRGATANIMTEGVMDSGGGCTNPNDEKTNVVCPDSLWLVDDYGKVYYRLEAPHR